MLKSTPFHLLLSILKIGDLLDLKRLFDIIISFTLLLLTWPLFIIIGIVIKITNPGTVLYWSRRIGLNNKEFHMFKFRTMKTETPQLATHLLDNPDQWLTPIGSFLRKSSLDELPQLINIIKGDMSFVGPRPALFNQHDLIELRTKRDIHTILPGLTGWAQINGRDELSIPEKVELDHYYLENRSLFLDLKIIFLTFYKVAKKEGVKH